MNETPGKTASCLAITEKRPHRPGGCVGIFFQLFDWNRRFAKKKFFSKKLLPPVRSKQASTKFGGDDKMPKTKPHLIADENSGGFPNVKKNGSDNTDHKHEMRTAGLVARLMGLESLPAVQRDKHKKASHSATCDVKEENFVNSHGGCDREVLNLEKGGAAKVECRPQKLQKTGQFERRAVTRFGAEALQIRNVLSRARKHHHHHHHPKLASPVKSPRIPSSRSVSRASRLIDAATRILEPGLQATNRAKCALTYSSSLNYVPKNEVSMDGTGLGVMRPDFVKQQDKDVNYDVGVGHSMMGQTSCKNCGNLLDVVDSRPTVEEKSFVCPSSAAYVANSSSPGLERIKPRSQISSPEQERDLAYKRNQVQLSTDDRLHNIRACSEHISDTKPAYLEGQGQRQLKSQQCRPQKDDPPSLAFQQRTETQNDLSAGRSRIPPRAKLNNMQSRRASSTANAITGAKDFVALNKSLSGRTRPRVSTKENNYILETERKFCRRRDDSLSQLRTPVRKRRPVSVNAQLGSPALLNPTSMRQEHVKCDLMGGKELGSNSPTVDRVCIKTRSTSLGEGNRANGNKDNRVVSFTFNSPLRHKETRDHINKHGSHQRKLQLDENDGRNSSQRQLPFRGDTLGALLEQKLKELTSQEEDEMTNGGSVPKRSTAMILQELIAALTAQQPFSPDGHVLNAETTFQTEGGTGKTSVGFSHDGDYLSPGSVLEASFSNDSCFSSSLDDSSGRRLFYDSMDYSCDQLHPIETNSDLLDSAASTNDRRTGSQMVADLLNHISTILERVDLAGGRLTGSRLTYAKEVILNAELLFGSAALCNADQRTSFLASPFLFDELETLSSTKWTNFSYLAFGESKEGSKESQVRRFLFDCVIEHLDSKYCQYCDSGFKAWRRVPLCMNSEMLIEEVRKEVRWYTNFVGMIPDEIIEWEMSHSLGKWTDFEIEVFETGTQIGSDILQVLIDESVIDFWDYRLGAI